MPTVTLETRIDAPSERVYDLARSVDCHLDSMADSGEEVVGGVRSGLLTEGDEVTWRARHFGLPMELTASVTETDRPNHFRDEQVAGPFASMTHDHRFESTNGGTTMSDDFEFHSPLGSLGALVDTVVLKRYFTRTLTERARHLQRVAESDAWRTYL